MALEPMTDAPIPLRDYVPEADAFVQMRVDWAGYEALLTARGEHRRPRMTYVDGVLELMTTSPTHERLRFLMGRLLERYAMRLGINLFGYSQTTYRKQAEDSGFEADEAYVIGDSPREDRPDLALEVVWTHGGVDKLQLYARFGVPEVWIWKSGVISVFVLRGDHYDSRERSELLPAIDLALLASFMQRPASTETLAAFEQAIR